MVTKVETEEVCGACGSTNIGYDALVKNIGGELEVVAGPYDRCICLTDSCSRYENETVGRLVLVQNLRYCDGKDCYYQGDKDVMTSKPASSQGNTGIRKNWAYWYCSRCIKEANGPMAYHKNEEME